MNIKFKFNVYLPSVQKYVCFKELDMGTYMTILKYIENDNDDLLLECFDEIISELSDKKTNRLKLNRIDLFCILLNIRIVCMNPIVKFEFTCEKTGGRYKIDVDLVDILDKITNYQYEYRKQIDIDKDISIGLDIPEKLIHIEYEELIRNSLSYVYFKGIKYDVSTYTQNQKLNILDQLPGDVFNRILRHIYNNEESFDATIFTHRNPHDEDFEETEYKLQLFNNSFFEFVKTIYRDSLRNQYYLTFMMGRQLHFDAALIQGMAPAEATIYMNYLKAEIDEQNKANKKTGGQSPMQLPNSIPNQEL